MTNKEFLECASKLQKEYAELYKISGLAGIEEDRIQISAKKFHELERENLLEHISKKLIEKDGYWYYKAMTPQGVKIIALEYQHEMENKK